MQELLAINPAPADPAIIAQANFENIDNRLWAQEAVTYAASIALDFSNQKTRTIALTGNLTLSTVAGTVAVGRSMLLKLLADASVRNLTFPAGWKFLGAAAPASIAASKTGLLELWSFGAGDSAICARWSVEP